MGQSEREAVSEKAALKPGSRSRWWSSVGTPVGTERDERRRAADALSRRRMRLGPAPNTPVRGEDIILVGLLKSLRKKNADSY